jgi:hypothetical protein
VTKSTAKEHNSMPQIKIDVFVSIDLHDVLFETISSSINEMEEEIKKILGLYKLPYRLKKEFNDVIERIKSIRISTKNAIHSEDILDIWYMVATTGFLNDKLEEHLDEEGISNNLLIEGDSEISRLFLIICAFEYYMCDMCLVDNEIKRSLSDEAKEAISHQYNDIFGSNRDSAEIQNERKMFDDNAIFHMETLLTIKKLHSQLEKFVIGR